MKKFLALLALLLLPLAALAASNPRTRWTDVPELLRPGKTERLVFDCPVETEATVTVLDGSGTAGSHAVGKRDDCRGGKIPCTGMVR